MQFRLVSRYVWSEDPIQINMAEGQDMYFVHWNQVTKIIIVGCGTSEMITMGRYDSIREGGKEGPKGLLICINLSHFIILFISFEISKDILK
jgi:hypothetical protein